jgi:hypothetical protein
MNKIVSFVVLCLLLAFLISLIFGVNGVYPSTFRDDTLISDGDTLKIVDGEKNTKWSFSTGANDKEMLPNGNILVTLGPIYGPSTIMEINITSNEVVWSISTVDGMQLGFTHDADWLGVDESGQDIYIAADTYNNRVVEFFRNGTVIWSWYAIDHYSYPGSGDPEWTHLNDVDRLPDGTTMISLKNFNKVVIVNTTASGEVLWEYGEYDDTIMLNGPHNPEYTPKRTLLIADSGNKRVIEVNMTTKEIIWSYSPAQTSDEALGLPRDADLLPNGNILICDSKWMGSGKNRIWEINTTTKEPVWYLDTAGLNYDADRLDTLLPTVNILSPINDTYDGAIGATVRLDCDDPWYDGLFYRIYDETAGAWLTTNNVTYTEPEKIILENQHTYTLHAWAIERVMEGGAASTSRAIIQLETANVQFSADELDPLIQSCNSLGEEIDLFNTGKAVYVKGNFFTPSTAFDLYVVDDITWSDGEAIPQRLSGTLTTVTSDADGVIPPTVTWDNPQEIDKYDIIVDVNGNGQYDAETDAIDDNDVEATAGFNVVLAPSPSPTISPSPSPSPSASPSPSPSAAPSPSPTVAPTNSPSPSPETHDQEPFPTTIAIAAVALAAVAVAGLLFHFTKFKK